jgi:hypothetical protein
MILEEHTEASLGYDLLLGESVDTLHSFTCGRPTFHETTLGTGEWLKGVELLE